MKKIIISLFIACIVSSVIPITNVVIAEELESDNRIIVVYEKLKQRLSRMPALLKMFEKLHSPQMRGDDEMYLECRYEFDELLEKYELAPTLIRALNRFNNRMAPYKKIDWWQRKGVVIPLAFVFTAAGLLAAAHTQKS